MGLESATYINDLVASNPLGTDPKSQGDDHIRMIKQVLRNTFPNINGAVTLSEADINNLSDPFPNQSGNNGKVLATDGTNVYWLQLIPTQTGNAGKVLGTNGTNLQWQDDASGDTLPSQAGNNGKVLTTNGTVASWQDGDTLLPSQTGNAGKFLKTDGTDPVWSDIALQNLTDVLLTLPATGDLLQRNSAGKWVNKTVSNVLNGVNIGVGSGQTWNNFTMTDRVSGVTYTNSTSNPIFVMVSAKDTNSVGAFNFTVNGISLSLGDLYGSGALVSIIIPVGHTYSFNYSAAGVDFGFWMELR